MDFSQSWFVPRSDCKPCEMHVVGEMKKSVLNQQASTGGADAVLQDAAGARVKR